MKVLVDYDNLPEVLKAQGLVALADRVFGSVRGYLPEGDHIHVRLYGGWFVEDALTKRAQDLQAALGSFPYPFWIRGASGSRLVPGYCWACVRLGEVAQKTPA